MSMYKGPYVFEYIGAFMRWIFLVLFHGKRRKERGLLKKILAGDTPLGERSLKTFLLNSFIGVLVTTLIVIIIVSVI